MAETLLKQNIKVIQKELGTYESVIKMQIDEPTAIPYLGNNSFISEMQQMTKVVFSLFFLVLTFVLLGCGP